MPELSFRHAHGGSKDLCPPRGLALPPKGLESSFPDLSWLMHQASDESVRYVLHFEDFPQACYLVSGINEQMQCVLAAMYRGKRWKGWGSDARPQKSKVLFVFLQMSWARGRGMWFRQRAEDWLKGWVSSWPFLCHWALEILPTSRPLFSFQPWVFRDIAWRQEFPSALWTKPC